MIRRSLLGLCCFLTNIVLGDVISCGGFIKVFDGVDRSAIRIRLLTIEGLQKYETGCNPLNGYYMIPIYNHGKYKFEVQTPEGWIMDRKSQELVVDGVKDLCSLNKDVDFLLNGFVISGDVYSGTTKGPAGVKLGLFNGQGSLLQEAITAVDGQYEFSAAPGNYYVRNVQPGGQCIDQDEVSVLVSNGPVVVKPHITISGHGVAVSIVDSHRSPHAGVEVILISDAFFKCSLTAAKSNQKHACQGISDSSGKVIFSCVPPGKYNLMASYVSDGLKFNFEPSSIQLNMAAEETALSIQITGFSTTGSVLVSGKPLEGVAVRVGNTQTVHTDANGVFSVPNIQSGNYVVEAEKPHYTFAPLNAVISLTKPIFAPIFVTGIDICGVVHIGASEAKFVEIAIKDRSKGLVITTSVSSNGKFCQSVPPAVYEVTVTTSQSPLSPEKGYVVDVTSSPTLELQFTKFKTDIPVSVVCIQPCNKIIVTLYHDDVVVGVQDFVDLKARFNDISPGSYKLVVASKKPLCFKENEISIEIIDSPLPEIKFEQTGYGVTFSSNRPVSLTWKHEKGTSETIKIPSSSSQLCFPALGTYTAKISACYIFESDKVTFSVPSEEPVNLVASKAVIPVRFTKSNDVKNHNEAITLVLDVIGTEEKTYTIPAKQTDFSLAVDLIPATLSLSARSASFIYHPEKLNFSFDGNCEKNPLFFEIRIGVFLSGSITPAVADVEIVAVNTQSRLAVKTDAKGQYKIGPLPADQKYDLKLVKEGYEFKKVSDGRYQAIQLSMLRVTFTDAELKTPLPEVLVSVSGVNSYRSNKIVGGSGVQSYVGLAPGEYFIVAVLPEYQFETSPAQIVVKEGEAVDVRLEGKRFAYSVFGTVSGLGGNGLADIRVEAISKTCGNLQEDALTDNHGNYRIRGLKLECKYLVAPKVSQESVYPPFFTVHVTKNDRTGLDFVLSSITETFEIFGKIQFVVPESQPDVTTVLLLQGEQLLQTFLVQKPSTVFIFANDSYNSDESVSIVVEDSRTKLIHTSTKTINIGPGYNYFTIPVKPRKKTAAVQKIDWPILLYISLAATVYFKPDLVLPYATMAFNFIQNLIRFYMNNAQGSPQNDPANRRKRR